MACSGPNGHIYFFIYLFFLTKTSLRFCCSGSEIRDVTEPRVLRSNLRRSTICTNDLRDVESSVSLERSSAEVIVNGFVAHLDIRLVYRNTGKQTAEVTYVCPVDVRAAVYSFEAKLEGRTITAHCLEKKAAKEAYKKAVAQGHTAILGSEDERAGDLLTLSLGNLPKGETAELRLGIVMELPVRTDGSISFTLPTVFNPRYSPSHEQHDTSWSHSRSGDVIPNQTDYNLDVRGEIRGSLKIARVTSESDPLNVEIFDEETSAKITQDGGSKRDHDWGFQVYYQTPHQPQALQTPGNKSGKGLMKDDIVTINLFPEVPIEGFSPHNELIFVIDRSGSMQGDRIQKAKDTLLLFLKSLPHGCRFNVVSFGSTFSALFQTSSERYTEETLKKALFLHKSIDANMGGTEILNALKHVYDQDLIQGYARQLIVLTDGAVWNQNQIFDLVSRFANETRVFCVGIGDGVSTALVQGIAEAGRGRSEIVINESQLQAKVMGLVASMLQETVRDLRVEGQLEPSQSLSLVPKVPPIVFGGQHLIFYARILPKSRVLSLKVTWRLGEKEIVSEINEEQCKVIHDTNYSFHRLAAKAQLKQWELEDRENTDEMIAWSLTSSVVCKATSFVGIDQDSKTIKEEEAPAPAVGYCMFGSSAAAFPQLRCMAAPGGSYGFSGFGGAAPASPNMALCGSLFDSTISERSRIVPQAAPKRKVLKGGGSGLIKSTAKTEDTLPVAQVSQEEEGDDDMGFGLCEDESFNFKECCDLNVRNGASVKKDQGDILMQIVSSQNFDGSWNFKDILNLVQISEDVLRKIQEKLSVADETCFATAVVLAFLQVQFASRKPEWQLLYIKGQQFLQTKGVTGLDTVERCSEELEVHLNKN